MARPLGGAAGASPAPATPSRDTVPSLPEADGGRVDHAFLIPLTRLFYPDPDPTEQFPGQMASVEGYLVTPGRDVTLALAVPDPSGVELLDAIWAAVRHKGIGVRRLIVLNDRGHVVSLMTIRVRRSEELLRLLQTLLLVPVRTRNGLAEVHLLATPDDFQAFKDRIQTDGPASTPSAVSSIPPVHDTGSLIPQDWAFLGLLSCVGAFDGPGTISPAVLAEALGIDLDVFVEHARAAERGLNGLVQGLFAPVGPGASPKGVLA